MPRARVELVVILGALTAFAPMSIDMYLPALPTLERVFASAPGTGQLTLAAFFLGFAIGQAGFGPLSDRFGRWLPLLVGLALFTLATVGCALAPSVEALMALRFFEALGACAGVVTARAIVRDLFEPIEAARMFSHLILVMGLAPILAPLAGGWILVHVGWAAIFWTLGGFGLVCLAMAWSRLPETRDPRTVRPLAFGRIAIDYARLLVDRAFMGYALTGGLTIAGMFAYIAASPFVFIELHGVAPDEFGWIFGGNAAGFVVVAQINGAIVRRVGPARLVAIAAVAQVVAALVLLAVVITGFGGIVGLIVPIFVQIATLGFLLPNSAALAMAPHGTIAGIASALLGTLQFGIASFTATGVGIVHDGTALPMASLMAACAIAAFIVHMVLVRPRVRG
ncbi:MAG: Bcr/CflA family multidrug efflux MFS transporter [Alphaproteobacteria bacterium]|nr:Bcr/CflA family multidrug efflux MFS transporter [Alphaproteobacteria bacterium]